MTTKMKKLLTIANTPNGFPGGVYGAELFEAQRMRWVEFSHIPQNSTTRRYKITVEGREALGEIDAH